MSARTFDRQHSGTRLRQPRSRAPWGGGENAKIVRLIIPFWLLPTRAEQAPDHARAAVVVSTMRASWCGAIAVFAVACDGSGREEMPVCSVAATSTQVGVTHGTVKIRDDSPVPGSASISLDAARNEVEPFQIVIGGGADGIDDLHVTKAALSDGDHVLAAAQVRLYQEGRYNVRWASSAEGGAGYWPDPLIPDVDAFDGEARNAFSNFDIAANQTRAVWVDIRVPADQPAGIYHGTFTVSAANLPPTPVAVTLRVRAFTLPATATLRTAFNLAGDAVTRAHFGGQWCSDFPRDQTNELLAKYARAALDNRISLMSPTCGDPTADFTAFDTWQGALLAGTAQTELVGARAQSFRNPRADSAGMATLQAHFGAKGWSNALFDYSCDEPPAFCDEASWPARAQRAHDNGIPNLVTTTYEYLQQKQWVDLVDIVCPVAETMNDSSRAAYDDFLARGPTKQLWWYQSCDSHGCGGCDAGMASFDAYQGLPSYVIDSDARQNRAMEWLSFIFDVDGELYFETAMNLPAGRDWDSGIAYCGFGGSGDGTLFYPGVPDDPRVGGTTHIPLESVRMKLIREGMEDYEYLTLYAQKFGRDAAVAKARQVFPDVFGTKQRPAELLYQVRRELADAIEGTSEEPLDIPHATGPIDLAGDLHEFAAATPVVIAAGDANAELRMVWDEQALYVAATVTDPDLRANGTGRDGPLYDADSIEVMLDPQLTRGEAATSDVLQVIASVTGALYDARGAGSTGDPTFDLAGLEAHAIAHGTINDDGADTGYQIVVAIPWPSPVAAEQLVGVDLALDNLGAGGLVYDDWAGVRPFAQPRYWHQVRLAPDVCH